MCAGVGAIERQQAGRCKAAADGRQSVWGGRREGGSEGCFFLFFSFLFFLLPFFSVEFVSLSPPLLWTYWCNIIMQLRPPRATGSGKRSSISGVLLLVVLCLARPHWWHSSEETDETRKSLRVALTTLDRQLGRNSPHSNAMTQFKSAHRSEQTGEERNRFALFHYSPSLLVFKDLPHGSRGGASPIRVPIPDSPAGSHTITK